MAFKGKAKALLRTYGLLSSILPYAYAQWEKLSILLSFLVPKLPAPIEEDLSKGILEAIDMDSYRVEKQAAARILLADTDAQIGPVPTTGGGRKPEPELDRFSNILEAFDQFGNIPWSDGDRVHKLITEDIPQRVAADKAYQNARRNPDRQNARIEHDKALERVMTAVLKDDTELFIERCRRTKPGTGAGSCAIRHACRRRVPTIIDRSLHPARRRPWRPQPAASLHQGNSWPPRPSPLQPRPRPCPGSRGCWCTPANSARSRRWHCRRPHMSAARVSCRR